MRFMICLDWMHSAIGKVIWNVFYSCDKHKARWITAKRSSWYEITLSYKLEFGRKFSFVTMLLKRCDKNKIVCSAYPSLASHKCQLQWKGSSPGKAQGEWECNGQCWLPGSANQWDCSNPWREQSITGLSRSFSLSFTLGTQLAQVYIQNLTLTVLRHWTFPTALRAYFRDKIPTGGHAAIFCLFCFLYS